jgi:hypothetical protein
MLPGALTKEIRTCVSSCQWLIYMARVDKSGVVHLDRRVFRFPKDKMDKTLQMITKDIAHLQEPGSTE